MRRIKIIIELLRSETLSSEEIQSCYSTRSTLTIIDEYDVQDLFHCQLISHGFEDIRREESNPSYAGANSRSDFLLKPEQTIDELEGITV